MIIEKTFYGLKCDNCKDDYDGGDYAYFDDVYFTFESAECDEWTKIESHGETKHYCPGCYEFDDNDKFKIKKHLFKAE